MFNLGSRKTAGEHHTETEDTRPWHKIFFEDYYAPLLCQPLVQLATIILLTGYLTGAVMGIFRLKIGFEIENLLVQDSPSMAFVQRRFEYYGDIGNVKS